MENRKRGQAPIAASGPKGASHDWGLTPFSTPPYLRGQWLVCFATPRFDKHALQFDV